MKLLVPEDIYTYFNTRNAKMHTSSNSKPCYSKRARLIRDETFIINQCIKLKGLKSFLTRVNLSVRRNKVLRSGIIFICHILSFSFEKLDRKYVEKVRTALKMTVVVHQILRYAANHEFNE